MKTKSLLTRISAAALFSAAALLPAALTSCSSDSEPTPAPDPIPEGQAMLNISFSSPATQNTITRAYTVTDDEAKISSLWLYIFYANGDKSGNAQDGYLYKALDVTDKVNNGQITVNPTYTTIYSSNDALPIVSGKYKFYLVANLDNHLTDTNKTLWAPASATLESAGTNETLFKSLQMNFSKATGVNSILSLTEALPMAADCKDITALQGTDSKVDENGVVDCTSGSVDIKMDMHFLCSGVRFTLLFDNTQASEGVEPGEAQFYDSFTMSGLSVSSLGGNYSILGDTNSNTATGNFTVEGDKYTFEGSTSAIITDPGQGLTKSDWGDGVTKKAYQAIMYLPENGSTASGSMTKLTMKYKLDNGSETEKSIVLPQAKLVGDASIATDGKDENILKRAHFYDVAARITSSGVELYVKVNSWKKHDIIGKPF